MKKSKLVPGIVLILAGAAGLYFGELRYSSEQVVDLGVVSVTRDRKRSLAIPQWASGMAIGAGIVFLGMGIVGKK